MFLFDQTCNHIIYSWAHRYTDASHAIPQCLQETHCEWRRPRHILHQWPHPQQPRHQTPLCSAEQQAAAVEREAHLQTEPSARLLLPQGLTEPDEKQEEPWRQEDRYFLSRFVPCCFSTLDTQGRSCELLELLFECLYYEFLNSTIAAAAAGWGGLHYGIPDCPTPTQVWFDILPLKEFTSP